MSRETRPFKLTLTPKEIQALKEPHGGGGHQELQSLFRGQLEQNDDTISLNDEELGKVIRYMTQYGSGGFQDRLRRAFLRSIKEQLGL